MHIPAVQLLCLEQEGRSLDNHMMEFLDLAYVMSDYVTYYVGLNNSTKTKVWFMAYNPLTKTLLSLWEKILPEPALLKKCGDTNSLYRHCIKNLKQIYKNIT